MRGKRESLQCARVPHKPLNLLPSASSFCYIRCAAAALKTPRENVFSRINMHILRATISHPRARVTSSYASNAFYYLWLFTKSLGVLHETVIASVPVTVKFYDDAGIDNFCDYGGGGLVCESIFMVFTVRCAVTQMIHFED